MRLRVLALGFAVGAVFLCGVTVVGEAPVRKAGLTFRRVRLTEEYFAEGASFGDFNKDGRTDVVCGPNWFEGPSFERRHRLYDGKAYPNDRGYSNSFFSYAGDLNGDGWEDVLAIGLPGTPGYWYENPGRKSKAERKDDTFWKKHVVFSAIDNEAPVWADLTGDGRPELLCTFEGRLGYLSPNENEPTVPWTWTAVSTQGKWHKYSHGLGVGDVNGDGRTDFLMPEGWWEQPKDWDKKVGGGEPWKHHAVRFAKGGAEIYAYDVDGDGDNDVISSLQAHSWGLSWFEHSKNPDGTIAFSEHKLMGEDPKEKPLGVAFSQLHALVVADVDGDGLKDIVTGKCYWAHNGSDPGARDPAVLYWFQLLREDGHVRYVPHAIDDDSGIGRQLAVKDADGDGRVDVVCGNKKGTWLFLQAEGAP